MTAPVWTRTRLIKILDNIILQPSALVSCFKCADLPPVIHSVLPLYSRLSGLALTQHHQLHSFTRTFAWDGDDDDKFRSGSCRWHFVNLSLKVIHSLGEGRAAVSSRSEQHQNSPLLLHSAFSPPPFEHLIANIQMAIYSFADFFKLCHLWL